MVYDLEKKRFYTYKEKIYTKEELKEITDKKSKFFYIIAPFGHPLFLLITGVMPIKI